MSRLLVNVRIVDQDGEVLADVDARSTADGLAYFLRSRGIEPDATEAMVTERTGATGPLEPIIRLSKDPMSGIVDEAIVAAVHPETVFMLAECRADTGRTPEELSERIARNYGIDVPPARCKQLADAYWARVRQAEGSHVTTIDLSDQIPKGEPR